MYGKLFEQMYDGSLACGEWEALVTLQQMIILADAEGVVDITAMALSRRTTIPIDIIEKGLKHLGKPDQYSRSKDFEGRRIIPIDPERDWGWVLVNYKYYRDLANKADKREKDRVRIADKRSKVSQGVAKVAHVKVNVDGNNKDKKKESIPPLVDEVKAYCLERKNGIDPQKFVDHYETSNWMRGKNKIKSWKACVRTWEGNNKNNNSGGSDGYGKA